MFSHRPIHYRFLIDALELLSGEEGRHLAAMIRRHRRSAWLGARDPDVRFRDFHNHVVHVTDGYWGGAPRLAHRWYQRMVWAAASRDWSAAVRAAGTMVHYVTDPLHPLHTAQCDRSRRTQLVIESIGRRYYDRWRDASNERPGQTRWTLSNHPAWLGEAVLHGARCAHRHYGTLLHDIDVGRARLDPTESFGQRFADAHVEMVGVATTLVAAILQRAAAEMAFHNHRRSWIRLAWSTVVDGCRVPWDAWADRRFAKQLLDYQDQPERWPEVDVVRRVMEVHDGEQRWRRHQVGRPETVNLFTPVQFVAKAA